MPAGCDERALQGGSSEEDMQMYIGAARASSAGFADLSRNAPNPEPRLSLAIFGSWPDSPRCRVDR